MICACRFETVQQCLLPQSPRNKDHNWKCVEKNMWCLLEFLYNGFLRPVDYLVHLLTEVSNGFLWGMRMFSLTVNQKNNLRREFDSLASTYSKKLWPKFPSLVDLSCYYDYIIDVDKHHFPGMHEANSRYQKFESELSKIKSPPTSIRKQFPPKVFSYFEDRPSKSSSDRKSVV